jgi:hypothetical protein
MPAIANLTVLVSAPMQLSQAEAMALQVLGINPTEARQCGYPMKEQSALAEAAEDIKVF